MQTWNPAKTRISHDGFAVAEELLMNRRLTGVCKATFALSYHRLSPFIRPKEPRSLISKRRGRRDTIGNRSRAWLIDTIALTRVQTRLSTSACSWEKSLPSHRHETRMILVSAPPLARISLQADTGIRRALNRFHVRCGKTAPGGRLLIARVDQSLPSSCDLAFSRAPSSDHTGRFANEEFLSLSLSLMSRKNLPAGLGKCVETEMQKRSVSSLPPR